jgi:hypothetical protein
LLGKLLLWLLLLLYISPDAHVCCSWCVFFLELTSLNTQRSQLNSSNSKSSKERHATKSAEGSKHSNNNTRAHLGKYVYTASATTKAAVSPITTNLNT